MADESIFDWDRADFALLRRAAREKWGVPDPLRTEALRRAAQVLADVEASNRDKLAAMKFLIEADKLDLESAKFEHQTKVADVPADDYIIDLSDDDPSPEGDPAQPGNPAPT